VGSHAQDLHERVSTQAILKIAARKGVTRDLFADPQLVSPSRAVLSPRDGLVEPPHPRRRPASDGIPCLARTVPPDLFSDDQGQKAPKEGSCLSLIVAAELFHFLQIGHSILD
jgi:hypothetical protein